MGVQKWLRACLVLLFYFSSSGPAHADRLAHTLVVTATAYNSFRSQTSRNPNVGAWGDRLKPGMKVIAVSRDLLRMGLNHGTRVIVQGLHGTYRVLDKMAPRWRKRIDVYMGRNLKAARLWGKRKVRISWTLRSPSAVSGHRAEEMKHRVRHELTLALRDERWLSGRGNQRSEVRRWNSETLAACRSTVLPFSRKGP